MAKSKPRRKMSRPARAPRKAARVKTIPAGYHTLTPGFCVRGAGEAIAFYKRAFGAKEVKCSEFGTAIIDSMKSL